MLLFTLTITCLQMSQLTRTDADSLLVSLFMILVNKFKLFRFPDRILYLYQWKFLGSRILKICTVAKNTKYC